MYSNIHVEGFKISLSIHIFLYPSVPFVHKYPSSFSRKPSQYSLLLRFLIIPSSMSHWVRVIPQPRDAKLNRIQLPSLYQGMEISWCCFYGYFTSWLSILFAPITLRQSQCFLSGLTRQCIAIRLFYCRFGFLVFSPLRFAFILYNSNHYLLDILNVIKNK